MTMTVDGILEQVLKRITPLADRVPSITEELLNTLVDITSRDDVDFLRTTSAPAVIEDQVSIDKPTGFKRLVQLEIEDVGPLSRITFDSYQKWVNSAFNSTGEPYSYADYGDKIYLYPTPDATYTAAMSYTYQHPRSSTTIELPDTLREAVYNGVMALLFRGQLSDVEGAADRAIYHDSLYEREIARQGDAVRDRQPRKVKYRDI